MSSLESPASSDELYRYRIGDIPRSRPIFQGDVFRDIEIPGLEDGAGLAIALTHACSMRNGVELRPHLLMARVVEDSGPIALPWRGHYRVLPLPELLVDPEHLHWMAHFDELGTVRTENLVLGHRVACLDDLGVVLLQQRFAHHLTRYVIETPVLFEQCANVLTEAELLEDWLEAALDNEDPDWDANAIAVQLEFEEFFGNHRNDLTNPSLRASVRRLVAQEISRRF